MTVAADQTPASSRFADADGTPVRRLVVFDGTCGLCHGSVKFLLQRDAPGRFRYCPLQSPAVSALLARHGLPPDYRGSVLLVENPGSPNEVLHLRSDAALQALSELGGVWRMASVFRIIPRTLRDAVYNAIAARRYRWFGRADACMLMRPEWRGRFLD